MGAAPSRLRLYRAQYRKLKRLEGELRAQGIAARYQNREVIVPLQDGRVARFGHEKIGPASNGETFLFPNLVIVNAAGAVEEWYNNIFGPYEPGRRQPDAPYQKGKERVVALARHAA